jgi:PAS domain S-box-containing protein
LELNKSLQSLADYKYSLDQSAIIAVTDAKGVIISANDNFCEIWGYSRGELEGNTHQLINSNYHPKKFFVDLWKTIASGKVFRGEIKNKAKDGTYYWVDTTIVPFLNEKKQPLQYLAIRFDITPRKKAQEDLTSTTERLQLATNSVKMGIWDWDVANDKLTWDDKMYHLYGVKKENFSGAFSAWQNGLHPDDVESATKDLSDALKEKGEFHSVFRVIWPDQSVHYIEGDAIVSVDEKGNAVRVIGSNIDITERINAQEDILKANERFEKVTQATNDAIWDWDIVNDTFYRSDAIERFFGKKTKKSLASADFWKDSFHPEDKEKVKNSVEEAIANPIIDKWQLEYRIIDETGETLYVIDRGVIIRDKKERKMKPSRVYPNRKAFYSSNSVFWNKRSFFEILINKCRDKKLRTTAGYKQ